MVSLFFKPRKKKEEMNLVLDIGTEAVKALVFQKKDKKVDILGSSLEYFDPAFGTIPESGGKIDGWAFEQRAFKKTISRVVQQACDGIDINSLNVIISLPANILKARVDVWELERKEPKKIIDEKKEQQIRKEVLEKAKKKVAESYFQDSGILPAHLLFINFKILEIRIDGYEVSQLRNYSGERLKFQILLTFLPEEFFGRITGLVAAQLKTAKLEIAHIAESLLYYFEENDSSGIFLDVGGKTSQIFLAKNGKLKAVAEFDDGGKNFCRTLMEKFGLQERDARTWQENYSRNSFSLESSTRLKEVLYLPAQNWFRALKLKLKEAKGNVLSSSHIYLFGGGSQLPEIKNILEKGSWEELSFVSRPEVEHIYPQNIKNIEYKVRKLTEPQFTPALLTASYYRYGEKSY